MGQSRARAKKKWSPFSQRFLELGYTQNLYLSRALYILIIEEAVDALYMTILQEMDCFFYANTPDVNMPEWSDQREE